MFSLLLGPERKQSFERNGFDKYIFIVNHNATKHGCCSHCEEVANKKGKYSEAGVYLVKDMMPGENAPPMHPHCRCSTAAWVDDSEYEAWLEYLEQGGTTEEWNKLKEIEKALENSENSSTMEVQTFTEFNEGEEVNNFFYYDDEKRGLLARKNSQYGKWKAGLSDDSKEAIFAYTADGYGDINKYLRRVKDWKNINAEMAESQIKAIDKAIKSFNLKQNIIVQRGAPHSSLDMLFKTYDINDLKDLIGKKYRDNAYMSTTALFGNPVATTKNVVFFISIPAGRGRGAYINEFSAQFKDSEYEFLIKHGATFTITDISEDVDLDKVYVTMTMDVD